LLLGAPETPDVRAVWRSLATDPARDPARLWLGRPPLAHRQRRL